MMNTISISHWLKLLLASIILFCASACESRAASAPEEQALPTVFSLSEAQTSTDVPATPTERVLRPIGNDRPTLAATLTPLQISAIASPTPASEIIITPTLAASVATSTPTRQPLPDAFVFGQSAGGLDLWARRLGDGERLLMLVGGIHGGWETNTSELMHMLVTHFEGSPAGILPGMMLVVVPVLNPDGATLGRTVEGRFNGNGVDLNRNWGCGWQSQAYFQSRVVSAGSEPMSEPETQALAALINDQRPDVVLMYHSAASGVYAGGCEGETGSVGEELSEAMSAVLGQATGYSYGSDFSAYPVTGTAPAWIASLGIASADVELATWRQPEFERNLRGVMAVQCWILGGAAVGIPACGG